MKDKPYAQNNSLNARSNRTFSIWRLIQNHPTISVLLLGIIAVVVVFIWKDISNNRQKSMIIKVATEQIESNQLDLMKIIAKPLVWNVRSEMLRGNMEQIDILISDLVKEKNFRYVHIIAPDGTVILSTNKSLEGKQIGGEVNPSLLVIESVPIAILSDTTIVVASPVMGVDKRLATLILGYETVKLKFEKK